MSDQQLKKLMEEKQTLQQELELTNKAIKVSEACAALVEYVTATPDPFGPNWNSESHPNPWVKGNPSPSPGGCCGRASKRA